MPSTLDPPNRFLSKPPRRRSNIAFPLTNPSAAFVGFCNCYMYLKMQVSRPAPHALRDRYPGEYPGSLPVCV
jgi:hypothetical protein